MSKLNQMPILDPAEFAAIFGEVTGDAVVVAEVRPGMPNEAAATRKSTGIRISMLRWRFKYWVQTVQVSRVTATRRRNSARAKSRSTW
jgi:hypothetical protein